MDVALDAIAQGQIWAEGSVLITNISKSEARDVAKKYDLPSFHVSSRTNPDDEFEEIARIFKEFDVDIIICSGYMKVIQKPLLDAFPDRIINIHPSVHEEYIGWQNMDIHEAIIRDRDDAIKRRTHTGYTIHKATEDLDRGEILTTGFVRVSKQDTPVTLQSKVKYAEGKGLVGFLQDITYPHKEELYLMQNGELIKTSFFRGIHMKKAA